MILKPVGVVFSGSGVMVGQSEVGLVEINFQTSVRVTFGERYDLSIGECCSVDDGASAGVALAGCSILGGGKHAPARLDRAVKLLH